MWSAKPYLLELKIAAEALDFNIRFLILGSYSLTCVPAYEKLVKEPSLYRLIR